jgi:hypothetical protein
MDDELARTLARLQDKLQELQRRVSALGDSSGSRKTSSQTAPGPAGSATPGPGRPGVEPAAAPPVSEEAVRRSRIVDETLGSGTRSQANYIQPSRVPRRPGRPAQSDKSQTGLDHELLMEGPRGLIAGPLALARAALGAGSQT